MSQWAVLSAIPSEVSESYQILQKFSVLLQEGLGRLSPEATKSLGTFAAAFQNTPLSSALEHAARALPAGELLPHHLVALAAGYASLQGAQYDALARQLAEAFGVQLEEGDDASPISLPELQGPLHSAEQWLVELALGGLSRVENSVLESGQKMLELLEKSPEAANISRLMTGFMTELIAHMPLHAHSHPAWSRWTDLWCRTLLSLRVGVPTETPQPANGRFEPIVSEVLTHPFAATLNVHGAWIGSDNKRRQMSTLSVSTWRVDALPPAELWAMFQSNAPRLVQCAFEYLTQEFHEGLRMGSSLLLGDRVEPLGAVDPYTVAAPNVLVKVNPLMRHPNQLLWPVALSEIKVADGIIHHDSGQIPLLPVPPYMGFTQDELTNAVQVTGVLIVNRQGFRLRPLLAGTKKGKKIDVLGPVLVTPKSTAKKRSALETLEERAGKLLRA